MPTVCKNAVRAANYKYLFIYAVSSFEVDSEDMMTPTADSLSNPARERLYAGEENDEETPLGSNFRVVRVFDHNHGPEFEHERE